MTDIVHLHDMALDETGRLVRGVSPTQFGDPTPCSEWDVKALMTHIVGGNKRWAALAQGIPIDRSRSADGPPPDLVGNDPAGAYEASAAEVTAAWHDPALLGRAVELPIGTLPGQAALTLHLVELVVHGWDLARATGQDPVYDPEVTATALGFTEKTPPPSRPPGGPFAPPVEIPDDAPPLDRLVAFLGRQP